VQISGTSIDPALDGPLDSQAWTPLVARRAVLPDTPHRFRIGRARGDAPAGGHLPRRRVRRLRANGELTAAGYDATLRRWLDTLPPAHLWQVLTNAGLDAALVAAALRERERPLGWASEVPAAFTPR
jgi:hypothetical protein